MNDLESTVRARLHDLATELPEDDAGQRAVAARTQHRRQRRNRASVLAVCAGLLVIAGGSTAAGALLSSSAPRGDVVTVPGGTTGPAPATSSAPTTPTPSRAEPVPTGPVPGGTSTAPGTGAPASSSPAAVPAPTSAGPTGSAGATSPAGASDTWPAEAGAVQGGVYWAVFLDVSRGDDTSGEQEALASLSALGYQGGIGDVGCAHGAVEALGLDPSQSYTGVSVFFDTAADAQRFVDLYQPGVVGTAQVTAYCLD